MLNFTPLRIKKLQDPLVRDEKGKVIEGVLGGGRPTLYNETFIAKVDEYINYILTGQSPIKEKLPTIEGFAYYLGVDADTINNWADKTNEADILINPQFFGAVKKLKNFQKMKLMNDGLYGGKDVSSAMAMFLLKSNHQMIETTNVDVTSKGQAVKQVVGFNVLTPENVAIDNSGHKANS